MKGTIPTEIGNLEHCWDFQVEGTFYYHLNDSAMNIKFTAI